MIQIEVFYCPIEAVSAKTYALGYVPDVQYTKVKIVPKAQAEDAHLEELYEEATDI